MHTHGDVIRDVGPTFVLVRKGVNVLVGSERRNRVVVPVSIGGKGVSGSSVQPAIRGECSYRGIIKVVVEAIQPRGDD